MRTPTRKQTWNKDCITGTKSCNADMTGGTNMQLTRKFVYACKVCKSKITLAVSPYDKDQGMPCCENGHSLQYVGPIEIEESDDHVREPTLPPGLHKS